MLWWVAVVVVPIGLLNAAEPAAGPLSLLVMGALAAVALADALRARAALAGIGIVLPAVVRLSKDRPAKMELRIRNEKQKSKTLRIALALPREIESEQEDACVALPPGTEWSRLAWTYLSRKRGNYPVRAAHLEASSPLGLWAARKAVATESEIRVYPNLSTERRNLAALFLHRGAFGLHAQRQVGQGRDFEKLRDYISGDSYDEIHWKATAKRGRPVTKVFQIERTQEVYVVVDASRLSARPAQLPAAASPKAATVNLQPETAAMQPPTALERFVTAALVLGLAAEQQGDLFGLLTFTNKVQTFVRAKNGKAHYSVCRDALYTLQPEVVTPDFEELCSFIRLRLRRRSLLVFLTALDDPLLAESFVRCMDLVRRQHLVMVNMLQSADAGPLFTDPALESVDDLYRHLGGHLRWHNLRELEKILHRKGVRFSLLKNERLSAELVSQYLSVKQRQLL
jgi:uncharacterized protein (DUF58 family)